MSSEMETVGAASLGGAVSHTTADLSGQACRNCGHMVTDRYCGECGQLAASFHRPFWKLVGEGLADSFALDGRIGRTIPKLLFMPGRVTHDYLRGHMARFMPPFRLFLLSSLIFFFVLFAFIDRNGWFDGLDLNIRNDVEQDVGGALTVEDAMQSEAFRDEAATLFNEDGTIDREGLRDLFVSETPDEERDTAKAELDPLSDRVANVYENQKVFFMAIQGWAPRLSVLLLPITVFILSMLQAWNRRIYIYDHTVHGLHLHAWLYLASTLTLIAEMFLGPQVLIIFALAVPLYTWRSIAVTYEQGFFMSLVRMLLLSIAWCVSMVILLVAVVLASALAV